VPAALLRDRDTIRRGAGTGVTEMVSVLAAAVPDQPWEVATWPTWRLLLPHVLAIVDHASDDLDEEPAGDITYLLEKAGSYLHWQGQSRAALPLSERVYERHLNRDGVDHPETLDAARMVAQILFALGDYQQARTLNEDTLARRRQVARTTATLSARPTTSHATCAGWVTSRRPAPSSRTPWSAPAGSWVKITRSRLALRAG
jgi:hypothetical protein